ncbi:MAG: response regulator, partial [Desulfobacterales bacterium]|nr:response regulator [Desulfobacterales bacterium]
MEYFSQRNRDALMTSNRSIRLLIIEDNVEVLRSLGKYFTKKKYEVVTASNGLDGLKAFESNQSGFDLIITDLVMPNISGVAIISMVKKKSPQTPVIAITGWGEHPEALATEAHADLVLEKPIELDRMDRFISDLLSKK